MNEDKLRDEFEKEYRIPDGVYWDNKINEYNVDYSGRYVAVRYNAMFNVFKSRQPEIDELKKDNYFLHDELGQEKDYVSEINELKEQLSIKEDRIKSYNEVIGVRGEEIDKLRKALEVVINEIDSDYQGIINICKQAIKESK